MSDFARAAQRLPRRMREPIVHVTAEQLLDVVEDLCTFGGLLLLGGRPDRGEALIEQAAELLAHRAHVLALSGATATSGHSSVDVKVARAAWMLRWTN
jgi:hypothetical protein